MQQYVVVHHCPFGARQVLFLKKCCTAHLDAFLDVQAANSIGINAPPMKDASEMTAGIKLDGLSAL